MITTLFASILILIFTALGLLHFYWLFGGKWGLEKAIPTKKNQKSSLSIPKFATLIVALVLLLFGLFYLMKTGLVTIPIQNWVNYGYWFLPFIFILRAIGEFNYVGIFKKIKDTEFAKADSKIFVPLCLFIGVIGILIQLLDN